MNGKLDEKTVKTRTGLLTTVMKFATDCMQSYLLEYCTRLSEVCMCILLLAFARVFTLLFVFW